jgi:tripartite-type tricarboxylate transporter receptor subunit TctC
VTRVALLVLTLIGAVPAAAENYPARPVRIVVGFPPGAAGDLAARTVAGGLSRVLGQQFIIDNKPGASSSIAAASAALAPKDGYTLFQSTVANAVNAALTPNLSFDIAKDFSAIALTAIVPVILVVHPSLGVNSVAELIALAKTRPGQLFYASTGVSTTLHLAGELLNARAGIKLVHVPYQGSPQAVTDLIAGRVQIMFVSASTVMPHVRAGTLKALATAAAKRTDLAPELPTMAELGLPDLDASLWFGLSAPAGTPRDVVDKLNRAVNEAVTSPEIVAQFKRQGFEPLGGTPEEYQRYLAAEIAKWRSAAEAAGVKK